MSVKTSKDLHITRSSTRLHAPPGGVSSVSISWDDTNQILPRQARAPKVESYDNTQYPEIRNTVNERKAAAFKNQFEFGDDGGQNLGHSLGQTAKSSAAQNSEADRLKRSIHDMEAKIAECDAEIDALSDQLSRVQTAREGVARQKSALEGRLEDVLGSNQASDVGVGSRSLASYAPDPIVVETAGDAFRRKQKISTRVNEESGGRSRVSLSGEPTGQAASITSASHQGAGEARTSVKVHQGHNRSKIGDW